MCLPPQFRRFLMPMSGITMLSGAVSALLA